MANETSVFTSKFLSLNARDLIRSGIMTVVGAAILTIYGATSNGGFNAIDWESVATNSLNAGLSYLIVNFFTPSKIAIKNPSDEAVQAVKDGEAKVAVITK